MKINNFQGDLTNISAKKEALFIIYFWDAQVLRTMYSKNTYIVRGAVTIYQLSVVQCPAKFELLL